MSTKSPTHAQRLAAMEADIQTLASAVNTLVGALSAPATAASKSKAVPLSEMRANGAGGVCTAHDGGCGKDHDGKFATANGAAYHAEHSGGEF